MLKRVAPFLAILAGCMWGSVGFFVRHLSTLNLSNMTIVESRMGGAAIMLVVGLLIYDRNLLKIKLKDSWCFIGTGILSMAFFNYCYNAAINITSLSLAAILLATAPIFVILLSRIIFGEKITSIKLKSLILALIGCVFVSGIFDGGASFSLLGILLGIASGIGYALYSIFSRFAMNKGYSSLTINAYSFIFATIGGAFFSDFDLLGKALIKSPLSLGGFLFLHALIASVAPYVLFTFSLKYMDTGGASILASCEPVTATLLGLMIYKEIPSVLSIIGIALVLVALALLSNPSKKHISHN
ncbi:transporter [Clostridium cylindrosporum DSM 605]|uniref:Transporter n=2 Tax=Clostridium cylindrosporum TaxID=1495 RepID=A0A0J8G4G9_CLOCY|nr:EamA family transporter [Clostridium cylindrosporum]KMT22566.1 transporter [Clostridium cylindrosporum DSM 605]